MEDLVKLVGLNIKEIRKKKNLTQEELAEKSGIQPSFLAGVERGDRNITLQTLEKITNGLEEDPQSIFKFNNLDIGEQSFNKNQIISLLVSLVSDKNESEVKLVYKIAKEIFVTYK